MKSLISLAVRTASMFFRALPRWVQLKIGDLLGLLVFDIVRLRRRMMLEHISIAFPNWTLRQKKSVARQSLQNMGRSLIEYFTIPDVNKTWVENNVIVEGREFLEQALAPGKGVFMLTLHVGNGDLALAILAVMGLRLGIVSKRFKNAELNEVWFSLRKKEGLEIIPEEKSSYQILRFLKQKGVVVFVLDQFMGPPVGVRTTFFGKETGTAAGLALFAERSGAPVLPSYTVREPDGRTRIIFEAPIFHKETPDVDLDLKIMKMTQEYTDIIERIVSKYPEQWLWLHRRWKTFEVR
jgi:Kdo2-lipid IVA lauroyltransferase/acyltransferase